MSLHTRKEQKIRKHIVISIFVALIIVLALAFMPKRVEAKTKTYTVKTPNGSVNYQILGKGKNKYINISKGTCDSKGKLKIPCAPLFSNKKLSREKRMMNVKSISRSFVKNNKKLKYLYFEAMNPSLKLDIDFSGCKKIKTVKIVEVSYVTPRTFASLPDGCNVIVSEDFYNNFVLRRVYEEDRLRLNWVAF